MTIDDIFRILRRHIRWMLILPTVSVIAAAFVSFYLLPPTYQSSTTLYVLNRQSENQAIISYNDLISSGLLAKDYRELALSRRVTQKVTTDLGISLAGYRIDVSSVGETRVIRLTVSGKDPLLTAQIANAVADEFSKSAVDIMGADAVNVIDEARVSLTPSGPARERNIMMAGLVGLAAAIGIAMAGELLNSSIRTAEDVERQLNLPVLAQVGVFNMTKD